jgi:propionyl-CoA synthetase
MNTYSDAYSRAVETPQTFWSEQIDLIDWVERPTTVLDSSRAPFYRWFPDGMLNTCL